MLGEMFGNGLNSSKYITLELANEFFDHVVLEHECCNDEAVVDEIREANQYVNWTSVVEQRTKEIPCQMIIQIKIRLAISNS